MTGYAARMLYAAGLLIGGMGHAAERDICDKMSGAELMRCIEQASRAAGAPAAPPAARQATPAPRGPLQEPQTPAARSAPAAATAPASSPRITLPTSSRPMVLPEQPVIGGAGAPAAGGNQRINCTKLLPADQPLCADRNLALLECSRLDKYPDTKRCLEELLARAADPLIIDCRTLPASQAAQCARRNRAYPSCKHDRLNYFTCIESTATASR